jgi:hypothetical protein
MQENMTYFFIIGAVVVALAALAALVNYVLSIVHGFRRDPPLPEEVAKLYATKQELAELKKELTGVLTELKREISGDIKDLQENINQDRRRVDGDMKQLFDLVRDLTAKDNEWHQSVNLMLGRIEGKVNNR